MFRHKVATLLTAQFALLAIAKKVVVQVKDGDQFHEEHIYGVQGNQQVGIITGSPRATSI